MAYDIFEANYIYKPLFKMNSRSESFLRLSSSKVQSLLLEYAFIISVIC